MRRKILTYFVYIILAATAASTVMMGLLSYNMFEEQVLGSLHYDAQALAALVEQGGAERLPELDSRIRVTLISADGTVTYDSEANPESMGSHAQRPEVVQALACGEGSDVRNSQTVSRNTFYYALRMADGGVVRVAQEASNIWSIYLSAMPMIVLLLANAFIMLWRGAVDMFNFAFGNYGDTWAAWAEGTINITVTIAACSLWGLPAGW